MYCNCVRVDVAADTGAAHTRRCRDRIGSRTVGCICCKLKHFISAENSCHRQCVEKNHPNGFCITAGQVSQFAQRLQHSSTCSFAFPVQYVRPSWFFSCWSDGRELSLGFYPCPDTRRAVQTVSDVLSKRISQDTIVHPVH